MEDTASNVTHAENGASHIVKSDSLLVASRAVDMQSSRPNQQQVNSALTLMRGELQRVQQEKERAIRERDELASRLKEAQTRIEEQNAEIKTLHQQQTNQKPNATTLDHATSIENTTTTIQQQSHSFSVRDATWKMQQWLFLEGNAMTQVKHMLTQYCTRLRDMGLPIDRLFIGDLVVDPQMSCYVWLWEFQKDFTQVEMPRAVFNENLKKLSPNEPFPLLLHGKVNRVTIKSCDEHISCDWFREGGYHDYLCLPIRHGGEFRGAISWATKSVGGFTRQHVKFFEESLAALSLVVRLHTNEANMASVMTRLEEEVTGRTEALATANQNLATANRRVSMQSQAQLKHFAMMSHEIRTPLNCIIGLSSLLLDTQLNPMQEESLRMITTSGDLLLRVVDDVLDYSKLASGKVDFQMEQTNLLRTVETVWRAIATKAACSNLVLRTHFQEDLPQKVITDGRRLQQVLYNLLGNAVKFGSNGEFIDFGISVRNPKMGTTGNAPKDMDDESCHNNTNEQPQPLLLRFVVKDFGQGIKEKDIENIFQPFQQATDSERVYGGTGLGLAITSNLVRGLGGTIAVKSQPGQWCEFVVELPLCAVQGTETDDSSTSSSCSSEDSPMTQAQDESLNQATKSVATTGRLSDGVSPPFDWSALKVLIAEDNVINQKVCSRTLARLGIQNVDIVDNGQKAVDASAQKDYDVIFMDLEMPVMGGLQATRIVVDRRNKRRVSYTPRVIILTAHALTEIKREAEKAGGDGFISKPFKLQKIERMLLDMFSTAPSFANKRRKL